MMEEDGEVLAATGFTGVVLGWMLAHSLDLDLDAFGAIIGGVAGIGALSQKGVVGDATRAVGGLTLAAAKLFSNVAAETNVASKVVGTVGEELLDVIELTSSAVTKGYVENMPDPSIALEKELVSKREQLADLRKQVDTMAAAFAEAQKELQKRDANAKLAATAAATQQELRDTKAKLAKKESELENSVQAARREKARFDVELASARSDAEKFKGAVGINADIEENFKELSKMSETLQGRVEEYEVRLQQAVSENEGMTSKFEFEVGNMEAERATMRERISELELALSDAQSKSAKDRAQLERDFALQADDLKSRATAAEAAAEAGAARVATLEEEVAGIRSSVELERAEEEAKRLAIIEQAVAAERAAAAVIEEAAVVESAGAGAADVGAAEAAAAEAAALEEAAAAEADAAEAAALEEAAAAEAAAAEAAIVGREGVKVEMEVTEGVGDEVGGGDLGVGEGLGGRDELMRKTVKDLRGLCKASGVPTTGKKADLVERLLGTPLAAG
ncbi:unnamed protein product [Discosporangium mesarthrocarpum]